ncbi:hypothetical protein BDZ97DRAFT_1358289 [Flammula alnicola]|nr:hypothetical protein BDZ97DRAFT_1358289 [Flammula alnicola]
MTAHLSKHDSGELVAIGQGIYFSKPIKKTWLDAEKKDSSSMSSVPAPTPILIFTWMGAKLPHVLKYTKFYDELYPEAAKIVARSEASFFWSTTWAKRAYLQPLVEALELLGCLPPATNQRRSETRASSPSSRTSLRGCSCMPFLTARGAWQLTTLSLMLASRPTSAYYTKALSPSPTSPLPASVLILDSCPSNGGVDKTIRAFTSVVGRNPILRRLVVLFVRSLYWYMVNPSS